MRLLLMYLMSIAIVHRFTGLYDYMPFADDEEFDRRQLVPLLVLLLAVPLQYLLTSSGSEIQRQYDIKRMLSNLTSPVHWEWIWKWCFTFWNDSGSEQTISFDDASEASRDVMDRLGNFGGSDKPRSPRPPYIKYRIGDVVQHKRWRYRGVIIGWDETDKVHKKGHPQYRDMPNYAVLIDTRDRLSPQMAYVAEEEVELITAFSVFHPFVDHFFEHFDGKDYLPRPWLKRIYPND